MGITVSVYLMRLRDGLWGPIANPWFELWDPIHVTSACVVRHYHGSIGPRISGSQMNCVQVTVKALASYVGLFVARFTDLEIQQFSDSVSLWLKVTAAVSALARW